MEIDIDQDQLPNILRCCTISRRHPAMRAKRMTDDRKAQPAKSSARSRNQPPFDERIDNRPQHQPAHSIENIFFIMSVAAKATKTVVKFDIRAYARLVGRLA